MHSSSARRFVFRADGNTTIGLGHLVRLLALADIVRGPASGVFVVCEPSAAVVQMVMDAGWGIHALPGGQARAAEATWLASEFLRPTDVLVLDGYDFTLAYQQRLRQSGCGLVYVDDLKAWPVVADVLINHSPGILSTDYQIINHSQLLLGPAFSLLRPPFLNAAAPPQPVTPCISALLCFGGADPLRLTTRTLEALLTLPQFQQLSVVVGSAFGDAAALQALAACHPTRNINLHQNVSATAFVSLLQAHAVAVVPASTVLIEALVLGRPAITGYYAENQRALADYVHTHQQAFSIGNFADLVGNNLTTALSQGFHFLAHSTRQLYSEYLQVDFLRATILGLFSR